MDDVTKCPFMGARTNRDWWPNQLNIGVLHANSSLSDPMGKEFNYAKEFKSLDLNAVIKVEEQIEDAVSKGARLACGGKRSSDQGFFYA